MGADILAYLHIDDNSGSEQQPFTSAPSTWDLSGDVGLFGCKDYKFFAAISGIRNDSNCEPLIKPRGLPPTENQFDPINKLRDELDDSEVGWLTLSEIEAALEHMSVDRKLLSLHVSRVLECMSTLESLLGVDHVRLVFAVHD